MTVVFLMSAVLSFVCVLSGVLVDELSTSDFESAGSKLVCVTDVPSCGNSLRTFGERRRITIIVLTALEGVAADNDLMATREAIGMRRGAPSQVIGVVAGVEIGLGLNGQRGVLWRCRTCSGRYAVEVRRRMTTICGNVVLASS